MLSSDHAFMIINSLPYVQIDMTKAVGHDKLIRNSSDVRNCFDVNSAVAGINLCNCMPQFFQSFTAIPRNLVVLNLSTENPPKSVFPWKELAGALQCTYPIALRMFSCARQFAASDSYFISLLHNLLTNTMNVQLTHLDITGTFSDYYQFLYIYLRFCNTFRLLWRKRRTMCSWYYAEKESLVDKFSV